MRTAQIAHQMIHRFASIVFHSKWLFFFFKQESKEKNRAFAAKIKYIVINAIGEREMVLRESEADPHKSTVEFLVLFIHTCIYWKCMILVYHRKACHNSELTAIAGQPLFMK